MSLMENQTIGQLRTSAINELIAKLQALKEFVDDEGVYASVKSAVDDKMTALNEVALPD